MTTNQDNKSAVTNAKGAANNSKPLRIAIFIDHNMMVRHFLQSGVLQPLIDNHDVTFVFPPEGHRRLDMDIAPLVSGADVFRFDINPKRRKLWSHLQQAGVMPLPISEHARNLRRAWRLVMNRKAAILYTFLGLPGVFSLFKWYTLREIKNTPYTELDNFLDEKKCDIVINPGVIEGIYVEDLVQHTKKRNIPFVIIMNSWDNPSLSVLLSGTPDHYIVWGEQTSQHAIDYLGMRPDQVVKFGVAQFQVYKSEPRTSREEFCRNHDIDPKKTVILYAGGSLGTNEFEHLKSLDDAIENGQIGPSTVVYRPHPWGGGGNSGEHIFSYRWRHVVIEKSMHSYLQALTERGYHMTFPDYRDTHDVLSSVDCVISPLSTIIIEAALHGKPVMCFLPVEDLDAKHFQAVYSLPHFADLFLDENVIVARGREAMCKNIPRLVDLVGDREFQKRIARTCSFFVEPYDQPYGERLLSLVENITHKYRP